MKKILTTFMLAVLLLGACAKKVEEHTAIGKIDEIKAGGGSVVITHEAFADGFMEAMTMPFDLADPKLVSTFKVGDQVKFTLSNKSGDWKITALEKAPFSK